jgi:hypothetical protein
MDKRRGSHRLSRLIWVALATGILCLTPISPAFACHAFAFEAANYSAAENAPNVAVVITRKADHQPSGSSSSVSVSTADGSAESGSDYVTFNQAVAFGPTDTSKRIEISLKDDTAYEGNQQFQVQLSLDTNSSRECTIGYGDFSYGPATKVTIQENDPQGAGAAPQQPGSAPATKAPAAGPGSASSPAQGAPAAASPSPAAGEEIGENVAADVPKQEDEGPPIKTILLIAGIVLVVGGAIGGYYYLGTRD